MTAVIICAFVLLSGAALFLKTKKQKVILLSCADAAVLAALILSGTQAAAAAVFAVFAAAVNISVFFIPTDEAAAPYGGRDSFFVAGNIIAAVMAGGFMAKNHVTEAGTAGAPVALIALFAFMAVSAAGYYIIAALSEGKK